MMKTLFYMGVLSICAFCAPAKADFTLFDGGSSFNFDTDTTGDWSLIPNPAVGGIDVLADFDFVIRTNYNSQETFFNFNGSLGSAMTINTVNLTGPNSASINFNPFQVPGNSGFPVPGLTDNLIPILNFTLNEDPASGHAILDYNINLLGLGFNDIGADLEIDAFVTFDYQNNGVSPDIAEIANSPVYGGETVLSGGDGALVIFQGDADNAVTVNTQSSLDSTIGSSSDLSGTISGAGNLVGGLQFSAAGEINGAGSPFDSTFFSLSYNGTVAGIPEPNFIWASCLVIGLIASRRRK